MHSAPYFVTPQECYPEAICGALYRAWLRDMDSDDFKSFGDENDQEDRFYLTCKTSGKKYVVTVTQER